MTTAMLSPAAAPPLAKALPAPLALERYVDAQAMRSLLQARLPGFADGRLRITALAVHSVRRSTSRERNPYPMTLCYELTVTDTRDGRCGTQLLSAQVLRHADDAEGAPPPSQRLVQPCFGEALVHLRDLNLRLWALPNDPGLPQLPALLDPATLRLEPPASHALAAGGKLSVELLRYAPQRRATLRYTPARATGAAEDRALYVKTFFDDRAREIDARFAYFWQLAERDALAPLVARPLGYDTATRSVWQAAAPGAPLRAQLEGRGGRGLIEGVAQALAMLHAAPLQPSPQAAPRTVAHWLAEVRRRRVKIERVDAAAAARVRRIAESIAAQEAAVAAPLGLIHGDCHPDQFWVHEGRLVLFDFDEFAWGDPMEDLAEFITKLAQSGADAALGACLAERYATLAPGRFSAPRLAWHLAIQALLQTSRAFTYQQPGWRAAFAERLAVAEARAAALGRGGRP